MISVQLFGFDSQEATDELVEQVGFGETVEQIGLNRTKYCANGNENVLIDKTNRYSSYYI